MVEMMVELISSSSNVHIVVDDNSNCYRSMVIDAMKMNQGSVDEYSIVDEELNVDATKFFDFFKIFQQTIIGWVHNHNKLLVIA